ELAIRRIITVEDHAVTYDVGDLPHRIDRRRLRQLCAERALEEIGPIERESALASSRDRRGPCRRGPLRQVAIMAAQVRPCRDRTIRVDRLITAVPRDHPGELCRLERARHPRRPPQVAAEA